MTAPQTLQTAPMTAATSPRVNLMPPEIAEAARFRQIQVLLGAGVLFAVVIVALLYLHAHSGVSNAKSELTQAQDQQTQLQAKLSSLAPVQQTLDEVQAKQALLNTAMGAEVRWSYMLNDLAFRMPSQTWLTAMGVTEDATSDAPAPAAGDTLGAPAPTSTAPVPIGTITFSGVGFEKDDVARWLEAMAKVKGYLDPTFNSLATGTIGDHDNVTFQGVVQITSDLFSHRFDGSATSTTSGAAQ
ncbi:MAG TPA: PilN domain-containing protein [Mycobacteriales bacterium]|nr:PilN domain-containing protein [Mycobacteriales bacterium]